MKQNHSLKTPMDAQRITSREIANITGKLHKVVLKAIREMEPAWEKECGHKFVLTSEVINMPQGGIRLIPVFSLTKTESLFVATKFSDEARARLVLRWQQLEFQQAIDDHLAHEPQPPLLLETEHDIMQRCDEIRHEQIATQNAPADGCLTTTELAELAEMTFTQMARLLVKKGLLVFRGRHYHLAEAYEGTGLARERIHQYYTLRGDMRKCTYPVWTRLGCQKIFELLAL
ncbi:Rha family transcriptional regulator [Prevotella sp. P6B1]|uniref:Rha family transcriptional regulator n=1 Tax=Prevotella sp. P6B1 TaxID=1410613 RepID=UPI0009DD6E32|nr:Rha family transcriptional regulator [Prevotella sp. P6B1]